jgi:hypothetical protein
MKLIYNIIVISFLVVITSCTDNFEEINTNPNAPIAVETEFLLRQVIYDYGEQMSYEGFVAGNLLGQYFTAVDFNLFDRHSLSEPQFGGNPWPILYTNLRDNELILQQSLDNPRDAVYEGPSRILKAYMTAALTDIFGDVPYSEALQGKVGNVTPTYDLQEDIYLAENGIIDNLNRGIEALENYTGTSTLEGDILYDGNLDNWIKFAKSLKLKYLMRISDIADMSVELSQLINEGGFISDNSENATFSFTDAAPNNFRLATARVGDFNLFVMSETMEDILKDFNDPRIETFFRPTGADVTVYNGLLNGPNASETSISIADFSLSGVIFREQTSLLQANFMTAWETEYLLAEAAVKGFFFGNATSNYNRATELAFEYWNTEIPENYLTTGPAAFVLSGPDADPIRQIVTQKWISNIVNGYEGWIEYRRTGFPELRTVAASLNDDLIPVRMPYPTDEEALNSTNYNTAADATNGNSINANVWWDID